MNVLILLSGAIVCLSLAYRFHDRLAGRSMVEGSAITMLGSAVRLNRYLFVELWLTLFLRPPAIFRKFWLNSGLAVLFMLLLAWNQGYKLIWPVFGATNQLLAALTLISVTVWLHRAGKRSRFTPILALAMLATTIAALTYYPIARYLPSWSFLIVTTDLMLLALTVGVMFLSAKAFVRLRVKQEASLLS